MEKPKGFITLDQVRDGSVVSFEGLALEVMHPMRTNRGEWMLNFTVQDESDARINGYPGLKVTVFRKQRSHLPTIESTGDVIVVRDIPIQRWANKTIGLMNSENIHTVIISFPARSIPAPEQSAAVRSRQNVLLRHIVPFGANIPTVSEEMHAVFLRSRADLIISHAPANPPTGLKPQFDVTIRSPQNSTSVPKARGLKECLIKDVKADKFYDLKVEVVKMYYSSNGTVDMHVTDYTENKDMFLYDQDSFSGWTGPVGQVTLFVKLWEPHASVARTLKVGDPVLLQNVRGRLSPDCKLEGVLHQDRRYPDKICVTPLTWEADKASLRSRRLEYQKMRDTEILRDMGFNNEPKKPSAKKAEKKKEKKKAQREARMAEQRAVEEAAEAKERAGINENVKCSFSDIKLSTIAEIEENHYRSIVVSGGAALELPFVNAKYRSRLRVIDFYPHELKNFSRCLDDISYNPAANDPGHMNTEQWVWDFTLLVEDAVAPTDGSPAARVRLNVNEAGAEYLLKMDACDLHRNEPAYDELKEKLWILWGNLQELHEVQVSHEKSEVKLRSMLRNLPFECVVEEYGTEVPGCKDIWNRLYRLNLTTIKGA